MKKLYERIRSKIEKTNESYKKNVNKHRKKARFQLGNLGWIHLRKERFSSRRKNKLMRKQISSIDLTQRLFMQGKTKFVHNLI